MLKRYGFWIAAFVVLVNIVTIGSMQFTVRLGKYPDQTKNIKSEHPDWHEKLNTNAHEIAGITMCNPRIVLCY